MAVPWRKNEDDAKVDGERPEGEVVMMDKDYKEKLGTEEHVPVPKRVYTTREDLEVFGFTARCPRCMAFFMATARQAHVENCRMRIEEELRAELTKKKLALLIKAQRGSLTALGTKLSSRPLCLFSAPCVSSAGVQTHNLVRPPTPPVLLHFFSLAAP